MDRNAVLRMLADLANALQFRDQESFELTLCGTIEQQPPA